MLHNVDMNLSEQQQASVKSWVEEGAGLAEVQRRLESEFSLKMTFLDTRFLVDDLKLSIHSAEPEKKPEEESEPESTPSPSGLVDESGQLAGGSPAAEGDGAVAVSLDEIAVPGTMVSGKVSFSDGVSARWFLDEGGRLGIDGGDPNYRPSDEDLVTFQGELQKLMHSKGF